MSCRPCASAGMSIISYQYQKHISISEVPLPSRRHMFVVDTQKTVNYDYLIQIVQILRRNNNSTVTYCDSLVGKNAKEVENQEKARVSSNESGVTFTLPLHSFCVSISMIMNGSIHTMADDSNSNEAALLASLGSRTADASLYESSILRNAKLRSAPKIELPHADIARAIIANDTATTTSNAASSLLIPCGEFGICFPNLSGMAPSTDDDGELRGGGGGASSNSNNHLRKSRKSSAEDVPHVLTVLSKVRRSLHRAATTSQNDNDDEEESRKRTIDVLHMKEQLCLSYLHNVAGVAEEDGIIPSDHYKGKRRQMRRSGSNSAAADEYYGGHDDSIMNDDAKPAPAAAVAKVGGKSTSTTAQVSLPSSSSSSSSSSC